MEPAPPRLLPRPPSDDETAWDMLCEDDDALAPGVAALCARHGLGGLQARRYDSGSLPVYAIGGSHVLKLFPPPDAEHASVEVRVLTALQDRLPIATPRLLADDNVDGWHGVLMTQLAGQRLVDAWPRLSAQDRDHIADQLGIALAALHALPATVIGPLADLPPAWDEFVPEQHESAVERQRTRRLDRQWLDRMPAFLRRWAPPIGARRCLLHTEVMREHMMVANGPDGLAAISGLFDFEPAMIGEPEYEFASVGLFVACGDGRFLRRVLLAYGYRAEQLNAALQCRLMAHAMLHRYSNLRWYLQRLPAQGANTFEELAAHWWPLQ